MSRVLFHVTHFPHPEHRDDLLAAMGHVSAAAPGIHGLDEIGAFAEPDSDRVVAISVWSSVEAMQAGMGELFASIGDLPFDHWESRPHEALVMPEVAGPRVASGA